MQLLQSEVPLNVSDSARLLVERVAALVWLSEANTAELGLDSHFGHAR